MAIGSGRGPATRARAAKACSGRLPRAGRRSRRRSVRRSTAAVLGPEWNVQPLGLLGKVIETVSQRRKRRTEKRERTGRETRKRSPQQQDGSPGFEIEL